MNNSKLTTSTLVGSALAATLLLGQVPQANAESALFNVTDLDRGYVATVGDHEKDKSGEGKCGEGKCGEGKCGSDGGKKDAEGKGDSAGDKKKDAEGKGGEGKCGSA